MRTVATVGRRRCSVAGMKSHNLGGNFLGPIEILKPALLRNVSAVGGEAVRREGAPMEALVQAK